jgi:hypothetical protein
MQGYNANAITLLADDAQTLQDESLTQIDGRTTLTFTKLLVEDGEPAMSINGTNLVFAFGSGNTFSYHAPGRGGIALSFGRDGQVLVPSNITDWKEQAKAAHGVLMGLSFGLLFPLGAIIARWHGDSCGCCRGAVWFRIHRTLQTTAVFFMLVRCLLPFAIAM